MLDWLKRIFGGTEAAVDQLQDDTLLEKERMIKRLQLDLDQRDKSIAQLKEDLTRERAKMKEEVNDVVESKMERLISDVATPISQLTTQKYLLEEEQKPLQAKDVLTLVMRLVHSFEDNGMKIEGSVGNQVSFNANLHEPLSGGDTFKAEQQATVRFVGIAFKGKIVRKASVVKTGE